MSKLWKVAKLVLLSAVGLLVIALCAVLGYRAYVQHANAKAIAIHSPGGIDEGSYVRIGGIEQWIQIRGEDRNNPVLLCLHGGPGATWTPLTALFVTWETQFTVVQWDQRGAGRTLEATGDSVANTMSVERMTQDGIEVSEFLRNHLHKDRTHSLGALMGFDPRNSHGQAAPRFVLCVCGDGTSCQLAKERRDWLRLYSPKSPNSGRQESSQRTTENRLATL